jgi:reactive intermediate/imine deaminase
VYHARCIFNNRWRNAQQMIHTASAPAASRHLFAGNPQRQRCICPGQIGLDPATGNLRETIDDQIEQAFRNVRAVAAAAGASFEDVVKLTLFLTDLANFAKVNETMTRLFHEPYPARSTVQVSALPKGAGFEVEALVVLP